MNALHAGIGSQGKTGLVHRRHGGNAQINSGLSGRGNHPGTADGSVRFPFQEQRVDGVVFRLSRHQLYKFQVIGKRVLHSLPVGEGGAAAVNDGAAEAMDPGGGIVGGAVLLHKAVAPPAGIVLHIGVQRFRCGGNLIILHITAVVHEQQRFKIQRQLVQGVFVGGRLKGHGQKAIQRPFFQQRLHRRQNPHFGKNADFIVGEQEKIRSGGGVIAHQLQRIGQAGFLFKLDVQLRHGLRQIIGKGSDHRVFLVMPDDQLIYVRAACFAAAGGQAQQHRKA